MEKSWFRLSICLKRFFNDERAQCYVSAEGHRPVRWLRRRLRRLFGPALSASALTCRGHLLPDDEPLALLTHDDRIVVVPVQFEIPCEREDCDGTGPSWLNDTAHKSNSALNRLNFENELQTNGLANEKFDNDFTDGNIKINNVASPQELHSDCAQRRAYEEPEHEESPKDIGNYTTDGLNTISQLDHRKQKALHLLDQYCHEDEARMGPRRKRRRVRRRRRPQHTEGVNCDSSHSDGASVEDIRAVARNTSVEVRPARLVQALPTGAAMQ